MEENYVEHRNQANWLEQMTRLWDQNDEDGDEEKEC
jgi:hypothetical protein